MGVYLNPGNQAMAIDRRARIYVDKSGLITHLNDRVFAGGDRYVCVSRPRRFGKTMAASMLCAYYQRGIDSHGLFDDLAVAQGLTYAAHLNAYDVVYLDMRQFLGEAGCAAAVPALVTNKLVSELAKAFPGAIEAACNSLFEAFSLAAASEPGHPGFVFIIDEWDAVFREAQHDVAAQEAFIGFLRDLLKDKPYVALAYMTGILPIKKYGTHSVLNMFDELSMTAPGDLASYFGFTEVETRALCDAWNMDYSEIKRWHDGYLLSGMHMYSPRSVTLALAKGRCSDYWTSTETYEALQTYIDLDFDGLRQAVVSMLADEPQKLDTTTFANDMTTFKRKDDVLTLLVHLGYLGYDEQAELAFIPNEEIRRQYVSALVTGKRTQLAHLIQNSDHLLQATLAGDVGQVARALEKAHDSAAAPLFYNNEQALRAAVKLAYISAVDEYATIEELPSGKGFADVVYIPKPSSQLPALLVELKWNKPVDSAVEQVKQRDYPQVLRNWGGPVLLVGISYDEKTKRHEACIERV